MHRFAEMAELGHEQVVLCRNPSVGLNAIIAIHDTTLGPSLGGCRLYDYASEEDALRDVLRLSRGMTYKAAVAGLDLGGGKDGRIHGSELKSGVVKKVEEVVKVGDFVRAKIIRADDDGRIGLSIKQLK